LRYSYQRVHVLAQREGFIDSHKRAYRLYRKEGLSLRLKRQAQQIGAY
jgi:putative transposase